MKKGRGKGLPTQEDAYRVLEDLLREEYGASETAAREKKPARELGAKTKKVLDLVIILAGRFTTDHLGAYAASAAYFFILSFLPFVMFLTVMIRYTDLTYGSFVRVLTDILPENFHSFVIGLVGEAYSRNTVILPLSMVLTLWTAGKAIQSLMNGLNLVYQVKETRNWLVNRIQAVFFTMVFAVAIIGSLVLLFFGNRVLTSVGEVFPLVMRVVDLMRGTKSLVMTAILFVLFTVLYLVLPNRTSTLKSQAPGALIVAVAWTIFSDGFALYYSLTPSATNIYGSMTSLILIMIWLYFCMLFLLLGAELNACFEDTFRRASQMVWIQLQEKRYQRRKKRRRMQEPYLTDPDSEGRYVSYSQEPARGEGDVKPSELAPEDLDEEERG